MKERGMIFNGEMVRAILDGRKTQTRRPLKWKQTRFTEIGEREDGSKWPWSEDAENVCDYWHPCPFGAVGDRIWVRETWQAIHDSLDEFGNVDERTYMASIPKGPDSYWHAVYAEELGKSDREDRGFPWRPSIHMPRWASRILLEITDVRVERLNNISHEDAEREGIHIEVWDQTVVARNYAAEDKFFQFWSEDFPHYVNMNDLYRASFQSLWKSIYGEESWQANPWVWVIEFKRVEGGAA